jgi:hypothetical protein
MRLRSKLRLPAFAASALLIVLGCVWASTLLYAKKHPLPKGLRQVQPPPAHFIRCAEAPYGSPCAPDPAMQQMAPRVQPLDPRLDAPQFTPDR